MQLKGLGMGEFRRRERRGTAWYKASCEWQKTTNSYVADMPEIGCYIEIESWGDWPAKGAKEELMNELIKNGNKRKKLEFYSIQLH